MKKQKKYLVTGGLGFVGNELVRQLKALGHDVVIVDNRNRVAPSIEDIRDVEVVPLDITNMAAMKEAVCRHAPDVLIHLAAIHYIPECNADPMRTLNVNVNGTLSVLKAAEAAKVGRVIFTSSGAVYADSAEPLAEDMLVKPVDIYGVSKLMDEQLGEWFVSETGITTIAFRLFNVYGPRETNAHIIPEIISQLRKSDELSLGNIEPRRDFIFTEDVAKGLIRLSEIPHTGYCVTNLASGHHASMRELIDKMAKLTGRNITVKTDPTRFRKADKLVQVANLSKLQKLTGWRPETDLETGLRKLLRFEGLLKD